MFKKIFWVIGVFILGISGLSFAMNCGEHGVNRQLAQAHSGHNQETMSESTGNQAVNAGNKICPVSGEKIGEGSGMEAVTYEYQEKIYNFCCASCVEEFKKNPDKYIKIIKEETKK